MIKFGTDGWRAIIDKEFTFDNVKKVAQSIADYLKGSRVTGHESRVVVGYDSRRLSKEFAEAVACVLAANEIKVTLSEKICSTPMVSYYIKKNGLSGGVMITASHNPPEFSGIKFKSDFAGPAGPDITKQLEELLDKNPIRSKAIDEALKMSSIEMRDLSGEWIDFVKGYIDFASIGKGSFKVLIDTMHGAGNGYMQGLLAEAGIGVETINAEPDLQKAAVAPEPIEKNLQKLKEAVVSGKFDIGIALDGDVDRVGAVDANGEYITAHKVLSLLLLHLIEDRKWSGTAVKTIAVTTLFDKIAQRHNLPMKELPVGFKHICKLMREEDVLIGGEESGGYGFKGFVPERDGVLAGLLLLEMMAQRKKGILEILKDVEAEYGKFCYQRQDCEYPDEKKKTLFENLKTNPPKELAGIAVKEIKTFDGAKFICEDGSWLLYRLSGTEPILRIYVEASSDERVAAVMRAGKELAGL